MPQQLSQQGRLFSAEGTALSGSHELSFRLYDEATGGALVWEETLAVEMVNGFYAVVLGGSIT